MPTDAKLSQFAMRHHGLIDRQTLRRLGLSDRQILRRVQHGNLERLSSSVFRLGGAPITAEQRLLAATWITSGTASHLSAGQMLGLLEYEGLPHVTTDSSRHIPHPEIHIHRTSDRPRSSISVRGVSVTNASRTLLDLAAVLDQHGLEQCVDRALRLRVTTPGHLFRLHEEIGGRGRRGSALASRVLSDLRADVDALESDLESLLLRLIIDADLPTPVAQYPIVVNGRHYRADFCFPEHRLIIEADGFGSHGERMAFESDRRRQNDLVLGGWTVLRFTWRQICREPVRVASQIRAALVP